MTTKEQFLTLFAYSWHTTRRLLDCAAKLDEAALNEDPGYAQGSIRGLFFHLLRTNRSWRMGLQTGQQPAPLVLEDYPTLKSLADGLAAEETAWVDYLAGLSEAQVAAEVTMVRRGEPVKLWLWRVLQHLALHSMQHHSELAHLLTIKGQSPGNIDFIFYSA